MFWEDVWNTKDLELYKTYIKRWSQTYSEFMNIFHDRGVIEICDAACGFGAFSAMMAANSYKVTGFDISETAIILTKHLLKDLNINTDEYIVSSITDIQFPDKRFDAAVAHAVIDHLLMKDAYKAVEELCRIVKVGGLVYLSFDGIEEDDLNLEHSVLEDGSFLYSDQSRKGLIFRYYHDSDIEELLSGKHIIYRNTKNNGEREVVLVK